MRERVFFISVRKDWGIEHGVLDDNGNIRINMEFNEEPIRYGEFADDDYDDTRLLPGSVKREFWEKRMPGDKALSDICLRVRGKASFFNDKLADKGDVCQTLTANASIIATHKPGYLNDREMTLMSTFPIDYDFLKMKPGYILGMCVPPVMMAHVASRIRDCIIQPNGMVEFTPALNFNDVPEKDNCNVDDSAEWNQ